MRVLALLVASMLLACAPPKSAHRPEVERALARAGLTASSTQLMQLSGTRVVLGQLAPVPQESEAPAELRIVGYDAEKDLVQELLPRAGWAGWAGDALVAVEGSALRIHRQGQVRTLLEHAAPDFAIDPGGKWIAAVVRHPELPLDTDLVLLTTHGGAVRTLAAFPGSSESRPLFTPDDRAVIFVSGKSGVASLYRVELADGRITQLTNLGATGVDARFVPPPESASAMRWVDAHTLEYEAQGRSVRVDVGGAR